MNLEDFSNNFTVTVVKFDNSTSNNFVNFKVQCLPNNRVSIHTATVDTTLLAGEFTQADVISSAWDSIKTTVNAWASYNIVENSLSELAITSTSEAIDLTTFNTYFTVKVTQFSLTPAINPTHWCIQLQVHRNTNESIYTLFTSLIPLTSEFCNNTLCSDIATASWELVKNQACNWAVSNLPSESLLNAVYTPTAI